MRRANPVLHASSAASARRDAEGEVHDQVRTRRQDAGNAGAGCPARPSSSTSAATGTILLDGTAEQVSEDATATADTTIKVCWDDWQAMAAGQLDGMTAFMTGKLKVEGDMSNAMQLQGVLSKLR